MDSLKEHEVFRGVYAIQVCAFDRKQALDLLKSDFRNDPNIDKVRITRVTSKALNNGECLYTLYFRLGEQKIENRPLCPECGSSRVISKGMSWYCRKCGRWFVKKRRT